MKERNVPRSGKCGDIVAKRNRYGQYLSKRPDGGKHRTRARDRAEGDWAMIAEAWKHLSEERYRAWEIAGAQERSHPRLGQSGRLSAWNYFFQVNNERRALGLGLLLDPPARGQSTANPVGALTITRQGGRLALKLKVSGALTGVIKVYGSPPQPRGRRRCWDARVLGRLPGSNGGEIDITELYVRKYGWPEEGKRVFIWTKPLNSRGKAQMKETNAVVPDWEPRPGSGRQR
jgi:hypothetical protein